VREVGSWFSFMTLLMLTIDPKMMGYSGTRMPRLALVVEAQGVALG